jgi:hypothetical protein
LNNDKTEIWVQSLTTTKAPSMNELKAWVPKECH